MRNRIDEDESDRRQTDIVIDNQFGDLKHLGHQKDHDEEKNADQQGGDQFSEDVAMNDQHSEFGAIGTVVLKNGIWGQDRLAVILFRGHGNFTGRIGCTAKLHVV